MLSEFIYTVKSLIGNYIDLLTMLLMPRHIMKHKFAFLIHPRGNWDIFKPFPFFRYLPESLMRKITLYLPPIHASTIEVKDVNGKVLYTGSLIGTVHTPWHMINHQKNAVIKVLEAGLLGEKRGAKMIGLGAYLPALSNYGRRFLDTKILGHNPFKEKYTSGHATTGWIICEDTEQCIEVLGISDVTVAIVGGAGSTGTAAAKVISRIEKVGTVALFDVNRESKIARMNETKEWIGNRAKVEIHTDLSGLINADIIVVVTTAEGTLIKSEHLKPGAIVIDDSQPRNTSPDILKERNDVLIIDVLARFPGLDAHFDFDLVKDDPEICFTCLAETAILAAHDWNDHFSIGILDVEKIDQIKKMGQTLGVTPAPFLSFNQPVTKEMWLKVITARNIHTQKHNASHLKVVNS